MTKCGSPKEKLEYAFDLYDADKNGFLDRYEIEKIVGKILQTISQDKREKMDLLSRAHTLTNECLAMLDASKDNKISRDEFVEGLLNHEGMRHLLSPVIFSFN